MKNEHSRTLSRTSRPKHKWGGAVLDAILAAAVVAATSGAVMTALGSFADNKVAADVRVQEETFRSVQQGLAAEGISAEVVGGNPLGTVDSAGKLDNSITTVRPTAAKENFAGSAVVQGISTDMAAMDADRGAGMGHQIVLAGAVPVTYTVETPIISPAGGSYAVPTLDLTITTTTPGAAIHYTLDGSEPTVASPTYSGPFPVGSGSSVVRARAFRTGWVPSGFAREDYLLQVPLDPPTITRGTVQVTDFPLAEFVFAHPDNPHGTVLRYTIDGSAPTDTSPVWDLGTVNAPAVFPANLTLSVRAFSADPAYGPSAVTARPINAIPLPLPAPMWKPGDGTTWHVVAPVEMHHLADPTLGITSGTVRYLGISPETPVGVTHNVMSISVPFSP